MRGRSNDGNEDDDDEDDNDESLSPPRIVKVNLLEFDDSDGGCRHPLMMLHSANSMAIKNFRRRTSHNMLILILDTNSKSSELFSAPAEILSRPDKISVAQFRN